MASMVNISLEKFCNMLADCERLGFMQAVKAYEPTADYIREVEINSWLRAMSIEPKQFRAMVNDGRIKRKRRGTSTNSPWYYSKHDIMQCLFKVQAYSKIINP